MALLDCPSVKPALKCTCRKVRKAEAYSLLSCHPGTRLGTQCPDELKHDWSPEATCRCPSGHFPAQGHLLRQIRCARSELYVSGLVCPFVSGFRATSGSRASSLSVCVVVRCLASRLDVAGVFSLYTGVLFLLLLLGYPPFHWS